MAYQKDMTKAAKTARPTRWSPFEERFFERIEFDTNGGCWLWTGAVRGSRGIGYGFMSVEGQRQSTHRLAYQMFVGPIPDGLLIRHKCDVSLCCNPGHLLPGTDSDNLKDAYQRGLHPVVIGEAHHHARHSNADAERVAELLRKGMKTREILAATNYGRDFINRIKFGRGWKISSLGQPSGTDASGADPAPRPDDLAR